MTLQLPIDLLTVCSPLLGTGCRLLLKALPLLGGSDDATAAAATSGGGRCGELGWGCAEAAMTLLEAHKAAGGDRRPGRLAVEAALGLAVEAVAAAGLPLSTEQVGRLAGHLAAVSSPLLLVPLLPWLPVVLSLRMPSADTGMCRPGSGQRPVHWRGRIQAGRKWWSWRRSQQGSTRRPIS